MRRDLQTNALSIVITHQTYNQAVIERRVASILTINYLGHASMDDFELDFAKIVLIRNNIAEITINNGVEIDLGMVCELHEFLISHLRAPFSLLINKINSYSYTFEAQKQMASIAQIKAMAVVAYRHTSIISTLSMAQLHRETPWKLEIFTDRETALQWLISEQKHSVVEENYPQYSLNDIPLAGY